MKSFFAFFIFVSCFSFANPHFESVRTGAADIQTKSTYGLALMGGGNLPESSFRWMAEKAGGGDFLVLSFGSDAWVNDPLFSLGVVNSVETIFLRSPEAAFDSEILRKISQAEALFLDGGNQWNYYSQWQNTPLLKALQDRVRSGVPLGGTSAGLAVMGEFIFTAQFGGVDTQDIIGNPFDDYVTLGKDFLHLPGLENTLTETHFSARNRMGRFLTFLARAKRDGFSAAPIGIAVDEDTVLILDPGKSWKVVGPGAAYRARILSENFVCEEGQALSVKAEVRRLRADESTTDYHLTVVDGIISSDQKNGAVY